MSSDSDKRCHASSTANFNLVALSVVLLEPCAGFNQLCEIMTVPPDRCRRQRCADKRWAASVLSGTSR